jgi:aromatic-L-amino-acid/L-tryptophan decarboxylase
VNDGVEYAASYCTNPHKWLFTNFDCSLFWVRDRAPLVKALAIVPEYLRNVASEAGGVIDYRDWQIPLGRRFRALKLWFVLRHYGLDGLRRELREDVGLAGDFAELVDADARFELVSPPVLNLICLRLRDAPDAATQALLETVNATGEVYLTHTRLDGRYAIRVCIGQTLTGRDHVQRLWQLLTANAESAPRAATAQPSEV